MMTDAEYGRVLLAQYRSNPCQTWTVFGWGLLQDALAEERHDSSLR